jgi:hypothetical protein
MRYKFLFFILLISIVACKEQNAVSEFAENNENAFKLYFYPSTLRMINIDQNPEYNSMIKEVKQARYFRLDSAQLAAANILELKSGLKQEGFEEVMSLQNKNNNIKVLALDKKIPEFVVLSESENELMLLEIQGMINVAKVPKLYQSFQSNAFLDVLNLKEKKNNN